MTAHYQGFPLLPVHLIINVKIVIETVMWSKIMAMPIGTCNATRLLTKHSLHTKIIPKELNTPLVQFQYSTTIV